MIKVLLAEDHHIVRNGIQMLIGQQSDIKVVAEASNGKEALDMINFGENVQVLITDINMPELSGLELLKLLNGRIKVIILSMLDNEKYIQEAFDSGASAYLLKNISSEELLFAIRHVASGHKYMCSELSFKLLNKLTFSNFKTDLDSAISPILTKREIEILQLIAEGYSNKEIAEKIFTSRRTVEGHREKLIEKTKARNTASLIKFAITSGLLK